LEAPLAALELPLSLPDSLPEELSELLVPFAELELPDDELPLDEWEDALLRIFECEWFLLWVDVAVAAPLFEARLPAGGFPGGDRTLVTVGPTLLPTAVFSGEEVRELRLPLLSLLLGDAFAGCLRLLGDWEARPRPCLPLCSLPISCSRMYFKSWYCAGTVCPPVEL